MISRYGYAIRLGGDTDIARALASGIETGTRQLLPTAASEAVMRVTLHRGRGPDYWEELIAEARCLYDTPEPPRPVRWLLAAYGLICWLVSRVYHMSCEITKGGD